MHLTLFPLLIVLAQLCVTATSARTDEAIEHRAALPQEETETALVELDEFDVAGWQIRGLEMIGPGSNLESIGFAAHAFVGEGQTRAMTDLFDYLVFKHRNGTLQDFCLDLDEKSSRFDWLSGRTAARHVMVAGVEAGLLPPDTLANRSVGVPFSTGTKEVWDGEKHVKGDYFGMREEDALRVIAQDPKTPEELARIAKATLNFLLTLDSDTDLTYAVLAVCNGETAKTELRLDGQISHSTELDEGCDPTLYGGRMQHEVPLLNSRLMEFLAARGVRDYRLECVNISSFMQNVQVGILEATNARIGYFSIEDSTIGHVDIKASTVSGPISMAGSTVKGRVRIEGVDSKDTLFLTRMRSEGRVDILRTKVDGIDLYQSSLGRGLTLSEVEATSYLSMNAMRSDGPVVVDKSSFHHSINLVGAVLSDELTLTDVKTAGYANFIALRSDGLVKIVNAVFDHSLSLRNAVLGQGLSISGMVTKGFGNFEGVRSQGRFEIVDSDFGAVPISDDLPIDPSIDKNSFYARSAQVDDIIHLRKVRVAGDLSLTNARAASIQLYDVQVSRDLVLGAVQATGPILVGNSGVGTVVGQHLDITAVRSNLLQIVHAYVGGRVGLDRVEIDTRLYLYNVLAGEEISAVGGSADNFEMAGVASPQIDLTGNLFERGVDFNSVVSDLVLADRMVANFLRLNMPSEAETLTALATSNPEEERCFPAERAGLPTGAEYKLSDSNRVAYDIQSGAAGCLGTLKVSGVQIAGDAAVAGKILGAVDFSTAAIGGRLDLAGPYARYGNESCVVARGMRSDSIVYDAERMGSWARPPRIIDLFGAEFRILTASKPQPANRLDWEQVERGIAPFFGSAGASCDPQSGYMVSDLGAGRRDYQPAIYDALAAGLERMGDYDQARKVRIIKNREFAANLSAADGWDQLSLGLTRFVYWLADIVSGYGYDNLKAVLWLAGLTLIGLVLGSIGEVRLAFALSPVARLVSWIGGRIRSAAERMRAGASRGWARARFSRMAPAARAAERTGRKIRELWPEWPPADQTSDKPEGKASTKRSNEEKAPDRPARPGLAFSIDRSIPSLGLDTAFGGHAGLGPILSTWFYTQRMLSFIILALMVASAFNVFQ